MFAYRLDLFLTRPHLGHVWCSERELQQGAACVDGVGVGVGDCGVEADDGAEAVAGEVVSVGFTIMWMIVERIRWCFWWGT